VIKTNPCIDWKTREVSRARDYFEVLLVLSAVTAVGWLSPFGYHRIMGQAYLLAVILLSLRVGRGAVLMGAVLSALLWNFFIVPPRLMFTVPDFDGFLTLGTYFTVALVAGQLTARIRAEERKQRLREQRATVLFQLSRALSAAKGLDEAIDSALRHAEEVFGSATALMLQADNTQLILHPASSLKEGDCAPDFAWKVLKRANDAVSADLAERYYDEAWYSPLRYADVNLGILVVRLREPFAQVTTGQLELIDGFATQIALVVQRDRLRQASEREKILAESERLHRTLLDSVSHELKTPLAVLRSAWENLNTPDGEKRLRLSAEIGRAVNRLDHLVANLLNQNRLESGTLQLKLDWCEAADLIGTARRGIGDVLADRPLSVRVEKDMPLFKADAPLMDQAISNLLINAVLHTPAGSPLSVEAGVEAGGARVFITVADRGPGLPPALRDHPFQKFRRGEDAKAGGLGLGLSIVRGFVLAQGGDVEVTDNPGGGARFTIYLPLATHDEIPSE